MMRPFRNMLTFGGLLLISLQATAIDVWADHGVFHVPGERSYVEVWLEVDCESLTPERHADRSFVAAEVIIVIESGENIANYDGFILESQPLDSQEMVDGILKASRRLELSPGTYNINVSLRDIHDTLRTRELSMTDVLISKPQGSVASDIMFVTKYEAAERDHPYYRHGFAMYPSATGFFPTSSTAFAFYLEFYQLPEEPLLVQYRVVRPSESTTVAGLANFEKDEGEAVLPLLGGFNITGLPTGSYELLVEVRNRQNEVLLEQRKAFDRFNRYAVREMEEVAAVSTAGSFADSLSPEELAASLRSLFPICGYTNERAITTILEGGDTAMWSKFLLNFWKTRSPDNPEAAFRVHTHAVTYVEQNFRTLTRLGTQTDRGIVYLKYGAPTQVEYSRFESGSMPYEIWQFDRTFTGETNVFFVFYSPDGIGNDLQLVHSSARGERKNPAWKRKIYEHFEGMEPGSDLEDNTPEQGFGMTPTTLFPE